MVSQQCPAGEVPPAPEELERIREERRLRREATSQPQADTGEACVGMVPMLHRIRFAELCTLPALQAQIAVKHLE